VELTEEVAANYKKQIKEEKEKIFKTENKTEPQSRIVIDKLMMSSETLYIMRLRENPKWMKEA